MQAMQTVSSLTGASQWQQMQALQTVAGIANGTTDAALSAAGQLSRQLFGESGDTPSPELAREAAETRPKADKSAVTMLKWRLCVHHGQDMPAEPLLLEVNTQVNQMQRETHVSNAALTSQYPVWDFNVELDVELYAGRPPSVEIKVMSARLFGRRHLFSGALNPTIGSNDVQRQEIVLESAPGMFAAAAEVDSKLVVAWQLCDKDAAQPELSRVAEAGKDAVDKQIILTDVRLKHCMLRTGLDTDKLDVFVRMSGVKLDEADDKEDAALVNADFKAILRPVIEKSSSDLVHHNHKTLKHFTFGQEMNRKHETEETEVNHFVWDLYASKVDLLSYGLKAELFVRQKEDAQEDESTDIEPEETSLGVWKDSLANLDDRIEHRCHQLHFNAALQNKEGTTIGTVETVLDVYVEGTEPHDMPVTVSKNRRLDVFPGMVQKGGKKHTDGFFVAVAALGLRKVSNPVLKIISAKGHLEATQSSYDPETDITTWTECLPVSTTRSNLKVRFEVWSAATLTQPAELIGQAMVAGAAPSMKRWKHLYGPAHHVNVAEKAEQMARGRIAPSTWCGSLMVHFTQRAVVSVNLTDGMKEESMQAKLTVQLHRGIYLSWYAGQNVTVLVQLAGCFQNAQASSGKYKRSPNLLSFPAKVCSKGLLHFRSDESAGLFDREDVATYPAFVDRTTQEVMNLPRDVSHAYVYIVSKGDEDLPPPTWAKFPVSTDELNPAQWVPVRYDQSVVTLNGSKSYVEDMAGLLLGTVCIHSVKEQKPGVAVSEKPASDPVAAVEEFKDAPKAPPALPVVTRPWSLLCSHAGESDLHVGPPGSAKATSKDSQKREQVFVHLDVLAARSLPSGDEDGVPDACYEVKIGDQTALLHGRDPLRSLDPVFMDRHTIGPLSCEVLPGEKTPELPPIVVRMLDHDKTILSHDYEVLGRAVIYNVPCLDEMFSGDGPKDEETLNGVLNHGHAAVWYALNSDMRLKFRRNAFGASADGSWARRPRLLMAAGYTTATVTGGYLAKREGTKWYAEPLTAGKDGKEATYKIRLDLLGLRYLPSWRTNEDVQLEVMPFWKAKGKRKQKKILRLNSDTVRFLGQAADQNPSFCMIEEDRDKDGEEYCKSMERLIIFEGLDDKVVKGIEDSANLSESRVLQSQSTRYSSQEEEKQFVSKDSVVGSGFLAPSYTVPIIPYLQTELEDDVGNTKEPADAAPDAPGPGDDKSAKQSGTQDAIAKKTSLIFPEFEDEYVLLPDIVIRLINTATGKDEGIACLSLPYSGSDLPKHDAKMIQKALRTRNVVQDYSPGTDVLLRERLTLQKGDRVEILVHNKNSHWAYGRKVFEQNVEGKRTKEEGWFPDWAVKALQKKDWYQHSLEDSLQLEELDYDWEKIPQWPNPKPSQDYVDVFIDVFAAESGLLRWDSLYHSGRSLMNQRLLRITPVSADPENEAPKKPVDQYFNNADWMFGQPHFREECFDWRVTPALHCEMIGGKRHSAPKRTWLAHSVHDALSRKALKADYMRNVPDEPDAEHALDKVKSMDVQNTARKHMLRSLSHLHVPERLRMPPGAEDPALADNLHTFVRKVGHRIYDKATNRISRVLARLRVGPPLHLRHRAKAITVELPDIHDAELMFTLEVTNNVRVYQDGRKIADVPPGQKVRYTSKAGDGVGVFSLPGKELKVKSSDEDKIQEVLGLFRTSKESAGEEQKGGKRDERGSDEASLPPHILTFKFNAPGVVVWAPPDDVHVWQEPGMLLFLVKVDATGEVVPVRVPSFDLRFEEESAWFPVKTFTPGVGFSKEVLSRAAKQKKAKEQEEIEIVERQQQQPPNEIQEKDGRGADGHSVPVYVTKNAFCCRIKQRPGLQVFDRLRTKNWFKTTLSKVFPEVQNIFLAESSSYSEANAARHFFLDRCLNVRKPMIRSEDGVETCVLKGHVEIQKVQGDTFKAVESDGTGWFLPLRRLWVQQDVVLRVCILTLRGLTLDPGVKIDADTPVYVVAKVNGMPEHLQRKSRAHLTLGDGSGCDFYTTVEIETTVPGAGTLQLEVIADLGTYTRQETPIGRAVIDIEDRWLASCAREVRENKLKSWIDQNLSPKDPAFAEPDSRHEKRPSMRQEGATTQQGNSQQQINPTLAPSQLQPIETTDLLSAKKLQANRRVGSMRFWVEMGTLKQPPPQVDFRPVPQAEYEIRMVVKNVTNITQFKDFGERNDVRVVAHIHMATQGQEPISLKLKTDVHKYARYTASFNWQWAFRVRAPLKYCYATFSLIDEDTLTDADLMYAPKALPLEYLVMYAHLKQQDGEELPGPVAKQVVFDAESGQKALEMEDPDLKKIERCTRCCRGYCERLLARLRTCLFYCCFCCCCCRRREKGQVEPAYLNLQVEIVTAEHAGFHPIQKDHQLSPPDDRIDNWKALSSPLRFFYNYLGPKNYFFLRRSVLCAVFFLSFLVIIACFYLLLQIVMPGIEIYDRVTLGAPVNGGV